MGKLIFINRKRKPTRKPRIQRQVQYGEGIIHLISLYNGREHIVPRIDIITERQVYSGARVGYAVYSGVPLYDQFRQGSWRANVFAFRNFQYFEVGFNGKELHTLLSKPLMLIDSDYKASMEFYEKYYCAGTESMEDMIKNEGKTIRFPLEYLVVS